MARTRGPKTKDGYHHGDLRAALLEAAVEQLRERGVQALSLRECARRAGVSHAAPYRHFADKDALLGAIAGQGFGWLIEAGEAAMEGIEDPRERVDAYGVAYVRFAAEHPEHFRLMFASEVDAERIAPEDRAVGQAAFELLRVNVARLVGPGEDEMPSTLAFWSLSHGLSMLIIDGRIPPEHVETPDAVGKLARAVFAQLRS